MGEITLGEREADVMKALWALGSGTVTDVRARLPVSLAYTTVLTILRRLQEKGFVEPEVEGRAHRYRPLISECEVRSNALSRLVSSLFGNAPEELVAHLIGENGLTPHQLERVRRLVNERSTEEGDG
jgi:predicted transcriptional regulator